MGDNFIINESKNIIVERVNKLASGLYMETQLNNEYNLGKNYAKFVLSNSPKLQFDENKLTRISYRPFDVRWTYFDNKVIWRWRENIMKNFIVGDNIGLVFERSMTGDVFAIKSIPEHAFLGTAGFAGQSAPLFIYNNDGLKTSNLSTGIIYKIENIVGKTNPENTFGYVYAVLYSPDYREKYKEFLKIDFPRVPYPKDKKTFEQLAKFGKELRELHLMESPKLNNLITLFNVEGTDIVEKIEYKNGSVYINDTQCFGNVPEVAWNFYIGGYQPAQKWLKNRKGRELTSDDIEHYQKIIVALIETDKIQKEIDRVIKI
jgi:predicted helicase